MIITIISLVFIFIVACIFAYELYKVWKAKKQLESILKSNVTSSFEKIGLEKYGEMYMRTRNITVSNEMKTNVPSSIFFNIDTFAKVFGFNLRMLDAASGILVGLGLLGTFAGLTFGVRGLNLSNSSVIMENIQSLLDGMGMAFSTSLAGMICSLLYTYFDKLLRHSLHNNIYAFTEKLDETYYIDDNEVLKLNQSVLIERVCEELENRLTYRNDSGENVTVGNAIREILTENKEQSKALKSFSTDLALELNNGFDEVLSRQMQEKILPLMENVDATTKAVVEHIDQMASKVSSPVSDMMENVVNDLKSSMSAIIGEFSNNLSGSATSQLEALAIQLGTASQAMGDFPKNMENISNTLQVTIDEVKNAVSEIIKTSVNANSTAMQQMQEQIAFATGSISNAITEVKEVMSGITQSSQEQSSQMIEKLADATDKMGTFLNTTIAGISSSVQNSMKSITDDVASKQADLMALHEDNTAQTKRLLEAFNEGLDRLEKMNEYIVGTMNGFKLAQGEISTSASNLKAISDGMRLATEEFNKGQNDYAEKLNQLQLSSQRGIEQVAEMMKESGQMSSEYVEKFEVIKQGLSSIFGQLQSGLSEYSRTVQATTQKYLDQYSSSLTKTTDALASTIQQQNEVVEMLNETLSRRR